MPQRSLMTLIGASLGLCLYALAEWTATEALPPRLAFAALTFTLGLSLGLMVLTGPLGLRRASLRAGGLALILSGLLSLAALRFAAPEELFSSALPTAALILLVTLPWPFLITATSPEGWRDYPGLFRESWSIVARALLAFLFTGLLWLTLYLSDEILHLAKFEGLHWLLQSDPAPFVITGAALGLATSVVDEIAPALSPRLFLRLLRLLLPLVLAVMALFLAILPFRGLTGLFGNLSAGTTLMLLAGLAVTLVTSALDEEDAEAAPMRGATRALAGLAVVPAGLAAWALGQRVADYGWTPDRLMAATVTAVLLAYGLAYLAVLARRDWMARIRQVNLVLALGQVAVAILWLTLLNPEAIASASQSARIEAGQGAPEDLERLSDWGLAGKAARTALEARGLAPQPEPDPRPKLAEVLPLRPDTPETRALRDRMLPFLSDDQAQTLQRHCAPPKGACVLAFADLLPALPGPEAMLLTDGDGYGSPLGFSFDSGTVQDRYFTQDGTLYDPEANAALIAALLALPPSEGPPIEPIARNQLALPEAKGLTLNP
ncbi:DUF4153 domain-containing protein [Stagnihabitans tardus]|uniref:DUF4153 domain-containing protein n=1 Tax=Stagnihabitans tardus TaxID=2699202 RepID=A0AAE5BUB6_9RHOB|nr:DUF4153 domain-containing protein [Stagnihabitans tardus]NBZ87696.1 DUF4153 domain-containing protein [Stagnihabitans tardus]